MADLYPPSYASRQQQQPYHRQSDVVLPQQHQPSYSQMGYTSQQVSGSGHSSSNDSSEDVQEPTTAKALDSQPTQKTESKPQATFLTKLYACVPLFLSRLGEIDATVAITISLLERPENHHMIRWDPAGEHIIVERPEQLALHVLPSIYRQSRFASFSRQLNVGASTS